MADDGLMAHRYRTTIYYLLLVAGAGAWAVVGLVQGRTGHLVFGILMVVVFGSVALITSPYGVQRRYYRSVHRVVTFVRGRTQRQ